MARRTEGITWKRIYELEDRYGTEMRDLANTFVDDPYVANQIMEAVFNRLRHMKAEDLADDEKLPALLADMVVRKCLGLTRRYGCANEERVKTRRASVQRLFPNAYPRPRRDDADDEETG